MMGPIVYCLERVDNNDELHSLYIDADTSFQVVYNDSLGLPKITADGFVKLASDNLYEDYKTSDFEKRKLIFIPYSAFANRGESDMLVFLNVK